MMAEAAGVGAAVGGAAAAAGAAGASGSVAAPGLSQRTLFDGYFFKMKETLNYGTTERDANGRREGQPKSMMPLLLSGAGAGAVTKTSVAPLERVKILFQLQGMRKENLERPKYRTIGQAFRTIISEEGATALWKGNGANVARVIPVYALKFGFNDKFKELVKVRQELAPGDKLGFGGLIVSGSMAGLFQQCVTYPLELVRTRLTMGIGLGVQYKGIVDCAMTTVRAEGFTALYVCVCGCVGVCTCVCVCVRV